MSEKEEREVLIKALCEILAVSREELLITPKQIVIDGISSALGKLKSDAKNVKQIVLDVVGPTRMWNGTQEELVAATQKRAHGLQDAIDLLHKVRLSAMELL